LGKLDSHPGGPAIDGSKLVECIKQAGDGNLAAYQKIYDQYARKVLNFIYRMVNSVEEAEDLTQETFTAVYQKLATLQDPERFEPWLFRIARNFVYQRYRNRQPAMAAVDALDEDGQPTLQVEDQRKTPDEAFEARELEEVVRQAIEGLAPKYREVFVLSVIRHLSYQEIAEIVGRSLASVKTDIHRARLDVRNRVKHYIQD
jgi:RNA polymerase sigma-70 factor (ECF subfamily)